MELLADPALLGVRRAGRRLYLLGNHGLGIGPALYLGGRFQIADRMTLTLRIGYPTLTFGVSFMM